mmetsp:Transcript_149967/g.272996  ORF Transcript_149967/g.272996 Transcript_149967/m.272996 type:complete len:218 (-) Transcript_149967:91-744(-)
MHDNVQNTDERHISSGYHVQELKRSAQTEPERALEDVEKTTTSYFCEALCFLHEHIPIGYDAWNFLNHRRWRLEYHGRYSKDDLVNGNYIENKVVCYVCELEAVHDRIHTRENTSCKSEKTDTRRALLYDTNEPVQRLSCSPEYNSSSFVCLRLHSRITHKFRYLLLGHRSVLWCFLFDCGDDGCLDLWVFHRIHGIVASLFCCVFDGFLNTRILQN